MLWLLAIAFSVAQTFQVVLYGHIFRKSGTPKAAVGYLWELFTNPVFLFAVACLSIGTALLRLWMFLYVGVTRTHVITSMSFIFSFVVFVAVFRENLSPQHYIGTLLVTTGIYMVSR